MVQVKGLVIAFAILLTIICVFRLSILSQAKNAKSNSLKSAEAKVAEPGNAGLPPEAITKLKQDEQIRYLDSVCNVEIFKKGDFKILKKQVGLNLQSNMHLELRVSLHDIISKMSGDDKLTVSLGLMKADEMQTTSCRDYVNRFAEACHEATKGAGDSLATFFVTDKNNKFIRPGDSDNKIIEALVKQVDVAVETTYRIISARIKGMELSYFKTVKKEGTNMIWVDLQGVENPERVRLLLQSIGNLEFWETWNNSEAYPFLIGANKALANSKQIADSIKKHSGNDAEGNAGDDTASLSYLLTKKAAPVDSAFWQYPLVGRANSILIPSVFQQSDGRYYLQDGCLVGYASKANQKQAQQYLETEEVRSALPENMKLLWSNDANEKGFYELYAIKPGLVDTRAPMSGDMINDAKADIGNMGHYEVLMRSSKNGIKIWKDLTRDNIHKYLAITLDDKVLTAPRVNSEIGGGMSLITGNFSKEDAEDLASIIRIGKLPARVTISSESVVLGIGAESTRSIIITAAFGIAALVCFIISFFIKGKTEVEEPEE